MMKQVLILTSVAAAALALAACERPIHPHHRDSWSSLKTITKLDCPTSQGDLTRKTAAADGKSCDYTGPDGAEVSIQLATVTDATLAPVLDPIAASLHAELPARDNKPNTANGAADSHDRVDIDLPGVHVHASGAGAQVDAGGHGDGNGGVHVDANDQGAEVHIDDQNGSGVRRMVILTSDTPGPHGFRVVGYEARGPVAGPIVVATVKTKSDDHDDLFQDVRDLVHHNVGG